MFRPGPGGERPPARHPRHSAYRRLGGGQAADFADLLATRRERLLDERAARWQDFALLTEAWRAVGRRGQGHASPSSPGRTG
ncbi:DUF6271 family protein [Streptomyces thinghirensis]|nr:DUF6271 family protein [Streptomyces thinghirensis]